MTEKSLKQQIEEEIEDLKELNLKGNCYLELDDWKKGSTKNCAKYCSKKAQLELLDKIKEIIEDWWIKIKESDINDEADVSFTSMMVAEKEFKELKTALIGERLV